MEPIEELAELRALDADEAAEAILLEAVAAAPLIELLADMPAWFMVEVAVCAAAIEAMAKTMMFLNCIFADFWLLLVTGLEKEPGKTEGRLTMIWY